MLDKKGEQTSKLFHCIFYIVVSFIIGTGLPSTPTPPPSPHEIGENIDRTFGGRAKYLTFLNLNLQFVYNVLCALNAIYEYANTRNNNKKANRLRKFCNFLYTSLAFPFGIVIIEQNH
jgi:hypothetical protein